LRRNRQPSASSATAWIVFQIGDRIDESNSSIESGGFIATGRIDRRSREVLEMPLNSMLNCYFSAVVGTPESRADTAAD
jgi:hypothetical protein